MTDIDEIRKVAVIGGGMLGSGIAQVALLSGYDKVTIIDLKKEILEKSRELIQERIESLQSEENFKQYLAKTDTPNEHFANINFSEKRNDFKSVGIIAQNIDTKTIMSRLRTETDLSVGVSDADFVIEAVSEILELKQEIFGKLGEYTPTHTLLATNTSTMSITRISELSKKKDKIIGMHFHTFFPIMGMLIEITPGTDSSEDSLSLGELIAQNFPSFIDERFTARLEKESPGFIGNRIAIVQSLYFSWIEEKALERGITQAQLESIGISPEGIDVLGVDTVYYCAKYFEKYVSPEFAPSKRIENLVKEGRLGKKVGIGFYEWKDNKPIKKIEDLDEKDVEFLTGLLKPDIFNAIRLNEACKMLEEGVVRSYELIDRAILKGTFMPGPFSIAKDKYEELTKILYDTMKETGLTYIKPCKMMESGNFLNNK
ncbi:MAG: 3-hydroxyacyl-CoA dehydrogenase NAD-binding domain-containing protein [Promethearchaeota archaeon]